LDPQLPYFVVLLHENIEDDNNALPHLQMKVTIRTTKGWVLVLGFSGMPKLSKLGWLLGLHVVAKLQASRGIKLLTTKTFLHTLLQILGTQALF
jgi:hypothetical protein